MNELDQLTDGRIGRIGLILVVSAVAILIAILKETNKIKLLINGHLQRWQSQEYSLTEAMGRIQGTKQKPIGRMTHSFL